MSNRVIEAADGLCLWNKSDLLEFHRRLHAAGEFEAAERVLQDYEALVRHEQDPIMQAAIAAGCAAGSVV